MYIVPQLESISRSISCKSCPSILLNTNTWPDTVLTVGCLVKPETKTVCRQDRNRNCEGKKEGRKEGEAKIRRKGREEMTITTKEITSSCLGIS